MKNKIHISTLFIFLGALAIGCAPKEIAVEKPKTIKSMASQTLERAFGKQQIKKMIGCYNITFDFQETFPLQKDYKTISKSKFSKQNMQFWYLLHPALSYGLRNLLHSRLFTDCYLRQGDRPLKGPLKGPVKGKN